MRSTSTGPSTFATESPAMTLESSLGSASAPESSSAPGTMIATPSSPPTFESSPGMSSPAAAPNCAMSSNCVVPSNCALPTASSPTGCALSPSASGGLMKAAGSIPSVARSSVKRSTPPPDPSDRKNIRAARPPTITKTTARRSKPDNLGTAVTLFNSRESPKI